MHVFRTMALFFTSYVLSLYSVLQFGTEARSLVSRRCRQEIQINCALSAEPDYFLTGTSRVLSTENSVFI